MIPNAFREMDARWPRDLILLGRHRNTTDPFSRFTVPAGQYIVVLR